MSREDIKRAKPALCRKTHLERDINALKKDCPEVNALIEHVGTRGYRLDLVRKAK